MVDAEILKERIGLLEKERECRQLEEQINSLKESLTESRAQQKRMTSLIPDQREGQGLTKPFMSASLKLSMEKTIEALKAQNYQGLNKLKEEKGKKKRPPYGDSRSVFSSAGKRKRKNISAFSSVLSDKNQTIPIFS